MFKKKEILFIILIGAGFIITSIFFSKNYKSQEDFYNQAVNEILLESYYGVVVNKFYDKYNHGRNKVIISHNNIENALDFVYEKQEIYNFIKIGDTLIKEKNLLEFQIKRKNLDTVIKLKFENIKGYEDFSNELD